MGSNHSLVLIFLVAVAYSWEVAAGSRCHFPAVYNFGDSNSDTGGLSAVFGQAQAPAGETFFHAPAGRYSDGRLIIDFIAEKLGLPLLSSYLDSIGSNYSHGANYATAGSTIRPQNTTLHQSGFSPISLDVQWIQHNQFFNRSQLARSRGGVFEQLLPKLEDFSHALYTFDIGQNDLTAAYFSNMSTSQVLAQVPDILGQLKNTISYVYGQGGRYFWIHNTGPFGCLPYVLERVPLLASQVDEVGCGIPFNGVAQHFNRGLKKVVQDLRKALPHAALTYVDVYAVKYDLISNATKYGFMESLRACCGYGGRYNYNKEIGCGGKMMKNGRQVIAASCKRPDKHIIWDGVHYTEAGNKWIYDHIADGSFSDPPVPLTMACQHQQSPANN